MEQQQQQESKKVVVIAGATGYAGRHLVEEYADRGWHVIALTRRAKAEKDSPGAATKNVQWVTAQVTNPDSLKGCLEGADLVISAVGITRQRDKNMTYRHVDYQANVNLLQETIQAKVPKFCYIHVLHAELVLNAPGVKAKHDFVQYLREEDKRGKIQSTVICPSGFFSDMHDFLDMAKQGRVWLFGDGSNKINPIHGVDLAKAAADAIEQDKAHLNVGGPDVLTHKDIAELAFECLGEKQEPRISYLWDGVRRFLLSVLPYVTPKSISGPGLFFLTAMGIEDMTGECQGTYRLQDYYKEIAKG